MLLRLVCIETVFGLQVIGQQFVRYFRRSCAVQDANPIRIHVEEFHVVDFNHGAACVLHPEVRKTDLRGKTRGKQQEEN